MMSTANFGGLIVFFLFIQVVGLQCCGSEAAFLAGAMKKGAAPASAQAPALTCV